MIVVKEEAGVLYVADIGPAKSQYTPGDLIKAWTPIGPGLKPTVAVAGAKFFIAFEYLGHTYVRELDPAVWPPEVVDPTTYTPHIALEEPHDAFGVGNVSPASMLYHDNAWDQRAIPNTLERVTPNVIFDLDTLQGSLTLQRKTSIPAPDPVLFAGWRVYRRTPAVLTNGVVTTPAGPWTLLFNWQTEVSAFTLIRDMSVDPFREELAICFGYLWDPEAPNADPAVTGGYRQSSLGPSLVVDSVIEPKTLQTAFNEPIGADADSPATPSEVLFGESQQFFSFPAYDSFDVAQGPLTLGAVVPMETAPPAFVIPDSASPGTLADFFSLSQGQTLSSVIPYT